MSKSKRQAVIIMTHEGSTPKTNRYGVKYRERGFWPWSWSKWKTVCTDMHCMSWEYSTARFIADQALANGVVPNDIYSHRYHAIIELDEES